VTFFTVRKGGKPTHFFDGEEENLALSMYESRRKGQRKRPKLSDTYTVTRQVTDARGEIVRMSIYDGKKEKWGRDMIIGGGIYG